MLQASLMFYKKLRKNLEEIGFEVNPYVANRIVGGKRHTITWHVDNLTDSMMADYMTKPITGANSRNLRR
jgi:hypothetical protein